MFDGSWWVFGAFIVDPWWVHGWSMVIPGYFGSGGSIVSPW